VTKKSVGVKVFVIAYATNLMDMVENTNFCVCKSKNLDLEIDVSNALDGTLTLESRNSGEMQLDYKLILNHFDLLEPLMAKPYLINP
jgi:hypothetical protein